MKKHILVSTILFSFLILSYLASFAPLVYATEGNLQDKILTILDNVVGLDLTKYSSVYKEYPLESYFGVPQENVEYYFESNLSRIKLLCSFTGERLHTLHVLEYEGTPHFTKSTNNTLEFTMNFLSDYQKYTEDSFYGELISMLHDVDLNRNSTLALGNIKLEVKIFEDRETFSWSYTFDGVDASRKCVSLVFKDGFLNFFIDTWDLYELGSTEVNLSEKEALDIAMTYAKTYSWNVVAENDVYKISNFDVTGVLEKYLVFGCSFNADNIRSEDSLKLYPVWRIGIGLDKFYPGNVFGIYVDIWADTKEIRHAQTVSTDVDPKLIPGTKIATIEESINETKKDNESINGPQTALITLPVLSIVAFGFASILLCRKNLRLYFQFPKKYNQKANKILLFLLLSSLLIIPISSAYAAYPMGRATVWGSLAPHKEPNELVLQDNICSYIQDQFEENGYIETNYQGNSSVQATLLNSIDSSEANYPQVATVWFDHGIGEKPLPEPYEDEWHYRIIDSNDLYLNSSEHDVWIFDYEIYEKTWRKKTFFTFISTCMSAKLDLINPVDNSSFGTGSYGANIGGGEIIGMPYAWTHGSSISYSGYDDPDPGQFCYIGFPWGSPSLDQDVDPDNYLGVKYYDWVWDFFKYALDYDMTINQALDRASVECFPPQYFGSTALYLNFSAIWPGCYGGAPFPNCTMEVYGNGNLKLYQYQLEFRAYDEYSNPVSTPVYIDGFNVGNTFNTFGVTPGSHTIEVADNPSPDLVFSHFGGFPSGQNPITINATEDRLFWVYYNIQYSLTISPSSGGYTIPVQGVYLIERGTPVQVTAIPDQEYDFDYWLLDGEYYSENATISLTMYSDHTLQAIFVYVPPNYPPNTPTLSGPSPPTYVDQSYQFSASTTDPDGDDIYYTFYWDDTTDTTVGPYLSGATAYASHSWSTTGQKSVTVRAQDVHEAWSDYSSPFVINIENEPVDFVSTPSVSGPTSGYVDTSYQFNAVSTDSLGHNIKYTFDWGDGSPDTETGWYASGATAVASHSWSSAGQKSVTVRAECSQGSLSSWSNPYFINIQELPPPPSEVGIWHLDEGTGSVAGDSSSYDNDGTIYGASWTSGQFSNALSFDGYNDYVRVPHDNSLAGFDDSFTVHAWIRMDDTTSRQSIIHKYDTSGNQRGWFVEFNSDNIQLFASQDGSGFEYWGTPFNPVAGTWYHVAVVWRSNQTPLFYIDGQPSSTWGSSTTSSIYNNVGAPLDIGRSTYSSDRYFDGKIDEVYLYSRELSAQEIADAAIPPTSSFESGIWHLDENSGSTAYDSSNNNNDGTINGATWTSGQVNSALRFDGTDDYVEVPHDDSLAGFTEAFTVHGWIRLDDITSRQSIIHKYDTSNNQRGWFVEYDDSIIKFFASPDGINYEYWQTPLNPTAYTWYHFAVVWETNQLPTFYIDGSSGPTWGTAIISQIYNNSGAPLHIGRSTYSSYRYFDGKIDEVYIYSRALSAQEVLDYYDSTN